MCSFCVTKRGRSFALAKARVRLMSGFGTKASHQRSAKRNRIVKGARARKCVSRRPIARSAPKPFGMSQAPLIRRAFVCASAPCGVDAHTCKRTGPICALLTCRVQSGEERDCLVLLQLRLSGLAVHAMRLESWSRTCNRRCQSCRVPASSMLLPTHVYIYIRTSTWFTLLGSPPSRPVLFVQAEGIAATAEHPAATEALPWQREAGASASRWHCRASVPASPW